MSAAEFRKAFEEATAGWPAQEVLDFEGIIRAAWPDRALRAAWIGTVQQMLLLA